MIFPAYFSKQARKPTGMFGRFYMSRVFDKGNAELHALVKEALCIKGNDHVLEIGFGTGKLLKEIADDLYEGVIEGADFSDAMMSIAQVANKNHIKSGKVKLRMGDFDALPFDEQSFDKIFSVNTIYFWKEPKATIAKMYSLLKPGGKLVLGFIDRDQLEKTPLNEDVFQYYSTQDVTDLLAIDGSLNSVDIMAKKGERRTCFCAVGAK